MNSRLKSIISLTVLIALPSATAHAQLGGLIKKAKQTITRDTTTPKPDPVKTDRASAVPVVVPGSAITDAPVTADRLDAMLRGFAAQVPIYQQRAEKVKVGNQLSKQHSALRDANSGAIDTWNKQTARTKTCMEDAIHAAENDPNSPTAQKMLAMFTNQDPQKAVALMQDQQATMQKSNELRAKGDTAGADRAMAEMFKRMGIDLRADTLAAEKKCGKGPPKLAAMVQLDDLQKRIDGLNEDVRALEKRANEAAATASGLSVTEFGYTRELQFRHLMRWRNCRAASLRSCDAVTPAENALFESRQTDVERILATERQLEVLWNSGYTG